MVIIFYFLSFFKFFAWPGIDNFSFFFLYFLFLNRTRKRGVKDRRSTVSKAEKLLHVFPEVAFTRGTLRHCQ